MFNLFGDEKSDEDGGGDVRWGGSARWGSHPSLGLDVSRDKNLCNSQCFGVEEPNEKPFRLVGAGGFPRGRE